MGYFSKFLPKYHKKFDFCSHQAYYFIETNNIYKIFCNSFLISPYYYNIVKNPQTASKNISNSLSLTFSLLFHLCSLLGSREEIFIAEAPTLSFITIFQSLSISFSSSSTFKNSEILSFFCSPAFFLNAWILLMISLPNPSASNCSFTSLFIYKSPWLKAISSYGNGISLETIRCSLSNATSLPSILHSYFPFFSMLLSIASGLLIVRWAIILGTSSP